MKSLELAYYGDDFTGSTDALEQLTLAGIRTALFLQPPTAQQLRQFPDLAAIGVAGHSRALGPAAMQRELTPVLEALKQLRPRHVHYKICSTFDSSPQVGNLGRVMALGAKLFPSRYIPLLVAAPALGRYTLFGQHFARYGIGSAGAIHRLDRHPSISRHPITPMTEADLRIHLGRQTKQSIGLFDVLKYELPPKVLREALAAILAAPSKIVLFDALTTGHLARIGALLQPSAVAGRPLFTVGSSGVEAALASTWRGGRKPFHPAAIRPARRLLVGSGSCSPVTSGQIAWALKNGFKEVALNALALSEAKRRPAEIQRGIQLTTQALQAGGRVIVHTTRRGAQARVARQLPKQSAPILGTALGRVLAGALAKVSVDRLCIAGGDTSSYAARELGITALEMLAPLTPGAPLCRAQAANAIVHGCQIVFKGGQVGPENYFAIVQKGKS